jgi:hypothetical protein
MQWISVEDHCFKTPDRCKSAPSERVGRIVVLATPSVCMVNVAAGFVTGVLLHLLRRGLSRRKGGQLRSNALAKVDSPAGAGLRDAGATRGKVIHERETPVWARGPDRRLT